MDPQVYRIHFLAQARSLCHDPGPWDVLWTLRPLLAVKWRETVGVIVEGVVPKEAKRQKEKKKHRINRVSPAKNRKTLTKKNYAQRREQVSRHPTLSFQAPKGFLFVCLCFVDRRIQLSIFLLFSSLVRATCERFVLQSNIDEYHTFLAQCYISSLHNIGCCDINKNRQ